MTVLSIKNYFLLMLVLLCAANSKAQLIINPASSAQALAQKLVGDGVTISNISLVSDRRSTGFFNNVSGTNIGIDSGIVLTNGRASSFGGTGLVGNGITTAFNSNADLSIGLPGDADLASSIGVSLSNTFDASILEFDFVPLGDSIQFKYVFSSEEYNPSYVCQFNDAFAFFISGPGFTGLQNIALIPGTSTPVSIFNVNNVPGGACPNNISYYIDNLTNTFLTHDGHTTILKALAKVQPCQTYHLKLVISDVGDSQFDSGVFLEAKSLSSNAIKLVNLTQADPASGNSYLVEGCAVGYVNIKRQVAGNSPLSINLSYGGTVQNGVDLAQLPASITIPANQDSVLLNIFPVMDLVSEGIETLKIYTLAGCSAGLPTDSTTIEIRDYDILGITPASKNICRNTTVQLQASGGYTSYQWDVNPELSNISIPNPVASPSSDSAVYICTASVGTCLAKDSALVKIKTVKLLSKTNVNCRNGNTGQIKISGGKEWSYPVQFSLNYGSFQVDSTFNNLTVGNYTAIIRDATNCLDSIRITLIQDYPDLIQTTTTVAASCSGNADGNITVNASGGDAIYQYSIDGLTYVNSNSFPVTQGIYSVIVRDNNGCTVNTGSITVSLDNILTVDAGVNDSICEGTSRQMNAISVATSYAWTPVTGITNPGISNPIVSPVTTTNYIVTVSLGICTKKDTITIFVRKAPVAHAGKDISICFGANATLQGSGAEFYFWSPSNFLNSTIIAQPVSQKPKKNIDYYLKVKDVYGCFSLLSDTMKLIVTPAVKLFAGNDTIAATNQPLQLQVKQLGAPTVTSYSWSPAYGLNNSNISSPVAILDRDFTYYVTGITPDNCIGSDTVKIKVYNGPEIYVPTAFSPNGDGRNDILRAIAVGMKTYRYFKVFNRWGQPVFSTQDFSKGWDGRVSGIMQGTGSFVWMAEAVDFMGNIIQRKGICTIIQ